MKQNKGAGNSNPTPQEQWKQFLLDLGKRKPNPPKFYDVIKYSQLKKIDQTSITLIFPTQEEVDKAKQQWQKIQNELPPNLKRRQIYCVLDTPEEAILESPLQVLKFKDFEKDKNGKELVKSVLEAVEEAEESCSPIYKFLSDRISTLAHKDGILEVEFPWRVHVGGMRGFRDLLLPAMHPIYGIPYIPASSLKGAIKAWAKKIIIQSK